MTQSLYVHTYLLLYPTFVFTVMTNLLMLACYYIVAITEKYFLIDDLPFSHFLYTCLSISVHVILTVTFIINQWLLTRSSKNQSHLEIYILVFVPRRVQILSVAECRRSKSEGNTPRRLHNRRKIYIIIFIIYVQHISYSIELKF